MQTMYKHIQNVYSFNQSSNQFPQPTRSLNYMGTFVFFYKIVLKNLVFVNGIRRNFAQNNFSYRENP